LSSPAHNAHRLRRTPQGAENYAKAIYELESREDDAVGTGAIAERVGVTPASASTMLKRLAEEGMVEYTPYHGVRLTERGEQIALEVIRHHRLLELFLAEVLEMPWDRVHEEAEVLEHHISTELADSIARKLGHPTRDPHGDPIPDAKLRVFEAETVRLASLDEGQRGRFVRVSDSDPAMLRYLSERGIAPGDRFEVTGRQPFDGPLTVRFHGGEQTLGGRLAEAMRVEVE
jgi:DtxR family Mn-dependent transcriptional regulator